MSKEAHAALLSGGLTMGTAVLIQVIPTEAFIVRLTLALLWFGGAVAYFRFMGRVGDGVALTVAGANEIAAEERKRAETLLEEAHYLREIAAEALADRSAALEERDAAVKEMEEDRATQAHARKLHGHELPLGFRKLELDL